MLVRLSRQSWTLPLRIVFALWIFKLFDLHLFLQAKGGGEVAARLPQVVYLGVLLVFFWQGNPKRWYPPLLVLIAVGSVTSPFAVNTGFARELILKLLVLYYILAIGSLTFVRGADKVLLLMYLFLASLPWYWLQSGGGRVPWHPELANEDSFGPLMVVGIGYAYAFGLAVRGWARRICFVISLMCLAGIVSSFARGAFAAALLVAVFLLLRSPGKLRNLLAMASAGVMLVLVSELLFPGGGFWNEMATIFTEGTKGGTGLGRAVLWHGAWRIFLQHPIFGVGAGNFGPYASLYLTDDPVIRAVWEPQQLWAIQLHNIFFQILCEFGAVGSGAFVWMLVDFSRRVYKLRSPDLRAAWARGCAGRAELGRLALALEAGMVGFLATGYFYNQLYMHWFYALLLMAILLHECALRLAAARARLMRRDRALAGG